MDGLAAFLDNYGLAAACALMLVKAMGVPIPIPGDLILLATAARAAEGKVEVWLAFVGLLAALTLGGSVQFLLARGPARSFVYRIGPRLGLSPERLDRVARRVEQGGPLAICVGVLTPGVRSAVVPACGLAGLPWRVFLLGLALGSAADIALHFAIGYAGAEILALLFEPAPVLVLAVLIGLGLVAWLVAARLKRWRRVDAVQAWAQATCPVCLVVGTLQPAQIDAIR
jgi:membrane protein DedA with SNARE-associated domain